MTEWVRVRPYTSRPASVAQFSGNRAEVLERGEGRVRVRLPSGRAYWLTDAEVRAP